MATNGEVSERELPNLGVTVIVATYNHAEYLPRCLRSLISQHAEDFEFEIIVVDDGSEDHTRQVLERFRNSILRIDLEKNVGLPSALNRAIAVARHELIVRVDSDDFVNKNFLSFLRGYIELNQDVAAVACDYLIVDDKEAVVEFANCLENEIACGVMFRKEALLKIGKYDEAFLLHEEKELMVRFKREFTVDRLAIPLYRYRRHQNNMTNNETRMQEFDMMLRNKHGQLLGEEKKESSGV